METEKPLTQYQKYGHNIRKYQEKNREKISAYMREYAKKNREELKQRKKDKIIREYLETLLKNK